MVVFCLSLPINPTPAVAYAIGSTQEVLRIAGSMIRSATVATIARWGWSFATKTCFFIGLLDLTCGLVFGKAIEQQRAADEEQRRREESRRLEHCQKLQREANQANEQLLRYRKYVTNACRQKRHFLYHLVTECVPHSRSDDGKTLNELAATLTEFLRKEMAGLELDQGAGPPRAAPAAATIFAIFG
jgi:hypothetical protein